MVVNLTCASCTPIASYMKVLTFTEILLLMWRKGLIPLPIGKNKKVIGLMKDELGGKVMTEFVALRAKMYAYKKIDKEVEEKRCKGTKKCVVAEGLTFDDYKTCLFDGKTIYKEQVLFENKKHEIYTVNKQKIALNRNNDKRMIQADGITTLVRGHVSLSA